MSKTYYRPYLTKEEIKSLESLLQIKFANQGNIIKTLDDHHLMGLWKKITELRMKIDADLIRAAHSTKVSFVQKLELNEEDKLLRPLSPEQVREKAFDKWKAYPQLCSKEEIELAQTYRFDNGMMSASEQEEFIKSFKLNTI